MFVFPSKSFWKAGWERNGSRIEAEKHADQRRPGPTLRQGIMNENIRQMIPRQGEHYRCPERPLLQAWPLFPSSDNVHQRVHQQAT